MTDILLIENLIHLITSLLVLVPIILIISIMVKAKGEELVHSLLWVAVGLLPLAIYHLFEFLHFVGIEWLPAEGNLIHSIITHGVVAIAFISVSWFFYLFKKRYVDPVYSKQK